MVLEEEIKLWTAKHNCARWR